MSSVPSIALNDGNAIPQLGFGVFQIDPARTAEAVKAALDIGYRHIDTAEMYQNEKGVGQGIRDAGVDRADVFITSKLNNGFHLPDDARRAFDGTLSALESDYVDLFLIHWPLPTLYGGDFVSTWTRPRRVRLRRTGPQHRSVELPACAPRPAREGIRHRPCSQPGRGPPLFRK